MLDPADQMYDDLLNVPLPSGNNAGIIVRGHIPGLVPPFEEHKARVKSGYKLPEWRRLHWWDRAIEIAMYRLDGAVEAILADEAQDKAK